MNSAAEKISARIAPLVAVQSLIVLRPPGTTSLAAVVVTVSIVAPLPVTVAGKNAQLLFAGNPAQLNVVTPLNPFVPATVTAVVAESPGLVTVIGEGAAETVKYHFIDAPQYELYDLTKDPGEVHNLISEKKAVAEEMRFQLKGLIREYSPGKEMAEKTGTQVMRT